MSTNHGNKSERKLIMLSVIVVILSFAGIAASRYYFRIRKGTEQPVHFSHRIHTSEKGISCFMCHDGAINTERAGIPPLQTCMLCHEKIIIHHPEIENLRTHYYENKPVEWLKVQNVPDFVFFNHSVHIYRQIDCSHCHGNVKEMDRIAEVNNFNMKFCVDCHKQEKATTDCFTCHR